MGGGLSVLSQPPFFTHYEREKFMANVRMSGFDAFKKKLNKLKKAPDTALSRARQAVSDLTCPEYHKAANVGEIKKEGSESSFNATACCEAFQKSIEAEYQRSLEKAMRDLLRG